MRGTGCKYTAKTCAFVHPSESGWADLPPYRAQRRSDASDRGRHRSPPILLSRMSHRSRSRSPRRSNPRQRSRSPVRKPPPSPTTSRFAPPPARGGPSQNDPLSDQLRDTRARTNSSASLNVVGMSMQPTPSPVQVPRMQPAKPIHGPKCLLKKSVKPGQNASSEHSFP